MTDATPAGADTGAPSVIETDPDAARYDAAFAEEGITQAGAKPEAEPTEQKPAAEPDRAPLPPEEVEKRWNDTKAALREERRQARELKQRIAALEAGQRTPQQQPATQPDPQAVYRPNPSTDPMGFMEYVNARLDAGDQIVAEQSQQQQQVEAQQRQVQTVVNKVTEYESDFALDTPDYYDAANHLRAERAKEYTALGYSAAQAEQLVAQEALRVSADLLSQGRDPAAAFYELAKTRGYGGAGTAQEARTATPAPAPQSDALSRVKAGQKAAQTLSGGGGSTNSGELDVGAISKLSGAAFDSAFDKLRAAAKAAERRTGF